MPKVAYTEAERQRIRQQLVSAGLELMAEQGLRAARVEQICSRVGISRSFFYSFFPTKEDLIIEAIYLQQPKVLKYAGELMAVPGLFWREKIKSFLHACCDGDKGIAIFSMEEHQMIFNRMTEESRRVFRERQKKFFSDILKCFGIEAGPGDISLFANLCLSAIIVRKAIPDKLPLFIPEAADPMVELQINAVADYLESLKARMNERQ